MKQPDSPRSHATETVSPVAVRRSFARGESTLVGRDADLLHVTSLLAHGARLVTIFGTAGVGKTRLAREIADRIASDGGRVAVVRLGEATTPEDALSAMAAALPIAIVGRRDVDVALRESARGLGLAEPLLLVLDDFDRLVDVRLRIVEALLAGGPRLQIIVTAREILRHCEERAYELPPLDVPAESSTSAETSSAFRLLVDRVCRYRASFPEDAREVLAAAEIVRRLDGIPLSIELLSQRVAMLGAQSVRDALVPASGSMRAARVSHSVDAAVESSWAHLDAEERRAVAQCAVFRGAFTIAALDEIVDRPASAATALDLAQTLREKSLLARAEDTGDGIPRFRMYATVRDFAAQRLTESDERHVIEARHAEHYLALAQAYAERADGFDGAAVLQGLAAERENIEAIVDRAVRDEPTTEAAARAFKAILALAPLAFARGPVHMLAPLLDSALPRFAETAVDARIRTEILITRGRTFRRRGLAAAAEAELRAALACAEGANDRALVARIHSELLLAGLSRGREEEAEAAWGRAWTLAREAGDVRTEGVALTRAAVQLRERGMLDAARGAAEQAVEIHRRSGNAGYEAVTVGELAVLAIERGDHEGAHNLVERASFMARASGNTTFHALTTGQRAMVRLAEGDLEGASEDFELALRVLREVGYTRFEGGAVGYLGVIALESDDLERADSLLEEARAFLSEARDRRYASLYASFQAVVRARRGDARGARELLAATSAELQQPDPFVVVVEITRLLSELAANGDAAAAVTSAAAIQATTIDQRVARRILRRAIAARAAPGAGVGATLAADGSALRIGSNGSWIELPGGARVDCTGRRAPILALLARERIASPGRIVPAGELIAAGWPGQRSVGESSKNRLRVALTGLRKLGLGDVIVSSRGGYALDSTRSVVLDQDGRGAATDIP